MTNAEQSESPPPGAESEMIRVRALDKTFHTAAGDVPILRSLDLDVAAGDALAIVGPSGCGKSTLLSILGALDEPTAGEVRVAGVDPFALPERERGTFRNESVGFVFQDHHLLPQCTVLENVLLPILATRSAVEADATAATELLDAVGLSHRVTHRPGELSGGERQRTALCRALVMRPKVLLADEPTGNLDPKTADDVADLLLSLSSDRGLTLLCVTHSRDLAARLPRRGEILHGAFRETAAEGSP